MWFSVNAALEFHYIIHDTNYLPLLWTLSQNFNSVGLSLGFLPVGFLIFFQFVSAELVLFHFTLN